MLVFACFLGEIFPQILATHHKLTKSQPGEDESIPWESPGGEQKIKSFHFRFCILSSFSGAPHRPESRHIWITKTRQNKFRQVCAQEGVRFFRAWKSPRRCWRGYATRLSEEKTQKPSGMWLNYLDSAFLLADGGSPGLGYNWPSTWFADCCPLSVSKWWWLFSEGAYLRLIATVLRFRSTKGGHCWGQKGNYSVKN